MEKGKEARCSRRWQSRGWRRARCRRSGPTSSPRWWRRPPQARQRRQAGGWRRKKKSGCKGNTSLAWAERRVIDIVIKKNFWKITSSPVMRRNGQQLEEVEWEHRCEQEYRFSITELCCVSHSFYTLQKGKWPFWTLRVRMRKDFDPCGFCGRHLVQAVDLWTLRVRMRKDFEPCGFWCSAIPYFLLVLIDWNIDQGWSFKYWVQNLFSSSSAKFKGQQLDACHKSRRVQILFSSSAARFINGHFSFLRV